MVTANSRTGVRRAVQEASTRWGGATEPIIPVRKGGHIDRRWKQVLSTAKVDGLVNVDAGDAGEKAAAKLGLTMVPIDDIDLWGTTAASLHPSYVTGFRQPQAPIIASAADAPLWEAIAAATSPMSTPGNSATTTSASTADTRTVSAGHSSAAARPCSTGRSSSSRNTGR
jgi:hypothetical protein